ncbi:MFS transporter [Hymenobacter psychrophilus]|uniref:Predicted arabinose efflux permease, MFS family n=1 Tax=Hymenobacter psychrophilus TaxID=651662 RepID=A0A1H3DDB5_9BACT|nr:MFS transporter [Hymenobacter psychrophilus]SDX64376.1 Predicted arabinose efflux permease, MFS family [Hymenobacter psychrophilus]
MSRILPTIVLAQFCCTSLWFAGNAVAPELAARVAQPAGFVAALTSAVQLGFIAGTLVFALLALADRFSPSRVFFTSALLAAGCNLALNLPGLGAEGLLTARVLTGFFLAGIYPVGMKIAADYYEAGLGRSLGFLVGALVLGTAFPHLLRGLLTDPGGAGGALPWQTVTTTTSALAALGGLALVLLVPDGPHRRPGQRLRPAALLAGFREPQFRAAAFGYFGHMWELYTFWAFVPAVLTAFNAARPAEAALPVSLLSFGIIGGGSLACVGAGLLAQRRGARPVAAGALALSGLCCLGSPLVLGSASAPLLLAFLGFWGLVVVADSPLFSTLVARHAPAPTRATALTLVTCLGFALTIVSIQLTSLLARSLDPRYLFLPLAIGPALGLWALFGRRRDLAA